MTFTLDHPALPVLVIEEFENQDEAWHFQNVGVSASEFVCSKLCGNHRVACLDNQIVYVQKWYGEWLRAASHKAQGRSAVA